MISSCHEEKKKAVFYDTESEATTDATDSNDDVITVPFEEIGGVKYVNVKVNGIGFEMIFDTGASTTLISLAEARYLWDKNLLTQDDIIKREQFAVADGSICVAILCPSKTISEMSPFAFEIYWMAHETYRLSISFLVREIIIIAIICVKTPRITSFLIIFYYLCPK